MIRVLVVDDHAVVRQGLIRILERARGIEAGGEAASGVEALTRLRDGKWDVVLLDISMPGEDGFGILKKILDGGSGARVLILSSHPEDQYAVRLMKSGASGYLSKDVMPEQLIEAIHKAVSGRKCISPGLAELLLHECSINAGGSSCQPLSNREYQVLRLMGAGNRVSDIASMLSLSVKTISTYRGHILRELGLKNNAGIILYAMQNRLNGP